MQHTDDLQASADLLRDAIDTGEPAPVFGFPGSPDDDMSDADEAAMLARYNEGLKEEASQPKKHDEEALYEAMVQNGNLYHASDHYRRECLIPDPPSCRPEAKATGHYIVRCLECGWVGCTDKTTIVDENDPMFGTFSYRCPQCDSGELDDAED